MRHLVLLATILLSVYYTAISQTYSFQHIGVEDGLSQSVITSVVQDGDGVFWIGTMSGLTRYDGKKYDIMVKEDGLAENWITSSMQDSKGNLWFGHWGGGVSFYDLELKQFKDMKFERFSNFKSITSIKQDNNGDIWFATDGSGIFKFESEDNAIVSLSKEDGFASNNIRRICIDAFNNIWFATNKGIVVYRASKKLEEKGALLLLTQKDGLLSDNIVDLELLAGNKIVAATEYDGISIISNINKLSDIQFENINKKTGLLSDEISCLFASNESHLWIGTRDQGVIRYDIKNNAVKALSTRQGLNYFKVNTIFKDREQNIWIGTDLGLNLFRGDEFQIYDETDGLINNVVWTITEDQENRLWLGTNEGVSRLTFIRDNQSGGIVSTEVKNIRKNDGLSSNIVLAIYANDNGDMWCGTGFGGITILDANGRKKRVIDSIRGLASNVIYSINKDKNGLFWAGTDKGVSQITANGKITNFTAKDGLGGDNIYKIFVDSKGKLWFASIGGQLSTYENGAFSLVKGENASSQRFITAITEDNDGNVWFGAYGNGVFKIMDDSIRNFTTANGLSSNSPYSMIVDKRNNLWIGTSKGIDKFNLETYTSKNYREKEGFLGIEPNPNAVCIDHEGNLWFGTIMGAVKFDLSIERLNKIQPLTQVEEIKVDHEPFAFPENHEFNHDENHLTFHYIGVSLTNPEHIEYKYMLENFDTQWSPITKNQDVIYSNLAPGSYEFKVMAANNDGVWNEVPTSYTFKINPPFWKTWWFYTLCVIFVVAGLSLGDKIRMRNLLAAKELLEKTVDERTAEVVEQKKVVEEKNHEILDSIKYAKRIQEAILPPDSYVKEFLKESFILYKPKDIVAGDFYFFETKGDDIYFAAADCTGHGVPGAMVSVVCSNALNRAVHELNISEPAAILDKVRELVVQTFQKSENEVKDGMDISFCKINLKEGKLVYTGAHNPLYRVTNEKDDLCDRVIENGSHVLCEYKGDKQPIGKYTQEKPFTQKEITLKKGDHLYLSTDGFPDQFGGERGKKFLYKPFKEMFLRIHKLPIEDQKNELDQAFENWRGQTTQIDDVCVIGIKIT